MQSTQAWQIQVRSKARDKKHQEELIHIENRAKRINLMPTIKLDSHCDSTYYLPALQEIMRMAISRISNATPGIIQNQPAQGVPLTAPMTPPIIMQHDAAKPTLAAVIAADVPESDIIKFGNKVIQPRRKPTLTTAKRLQKVPAMATKRRDSTRWRSNIVGSFIGTVDVARGSNDGDTLLLFDKLVLLLRGWAYSDLEVLSMSFLN